MTESVSPRPLRLFLDAEFTGLHQFSTLISLAFVSEAGEAFYAEFTDFDREQVDDWLREQVLAHTRWLREGLEGPWTDNAVESSEQEPSCHRRKAPHPNPLPSGERETPALKPTVLPWTGREDGLTLCLGDSGFIREQLVAWLDRFPAIEIWADCPAWDWVLFCQLFGGALGIPKHIFYLPLDLATLFHCRGLSADTPRAEFAGIAPAGSLGQPHNALWDAQVLRACHARLAKWA